MSLFGETLKKMRRQHNISQMQLADELYVSRSCIANWETGRRVPDITVLSRLALLFGVDISLLAGTLDTDVPSPDVIMVDDETILLAGTIPVLAEVMPLATITGFTKASEALSFSQRNRVSIAFLDIALGKTSGLDLCRSLIETNPLINVIFITSYPEYALNAWDTAASGFLVKPVSLEDVRSQLDKLRYPVSGLC